MKNSLVQIWIFPLLLLGGCVQLPDRSADERPPIKYDVKCGGDCLQLNTTAAADRHAFLNKIIEHVQAGRLASAEALVERRLDVAIEALRQRDARQAPSTAELALARAVDARLGHSADDGWHAWLQGRSNGGLQRAEETLAQANELSRGRHWAQVRDLLRKSQANLAAYPYHAIHAGLLLADAQRRLGEVQLSAQTWQQTAILTARHATRWLIPALWEAVASQRPIATPWPAEVADNLNALLPPPLHDLPKDAAFTPEALVWFAIGKGRLQRSEAALALTAFKRADSLGAFSQWDDFLALHQAKALLALDQAPAAISVLDAMASRPADSLWRLPALALLGSVKLHEGQTQQAVGILRQAVEESSTDFFCRAEAEADLGLAYLSLGDGTRGLACLHAAQTRLQAEGRVEVLLTCLANEAAYLGGAGRADLAEQVQTRIRELQRSGP